MNVFPWTSCIISDGWYLCQTCKVVYNLYSPGQNVPTYKPICDFLLIFDRHSTNWASEYGILNSYLFIKASAFLSFIDRYIICILRNLFCTMHWVLTLHLVPSTTLTNDNGYQFERSARYQSIMSIALDWRYVF